MGATWESVTVKGAESHSMDLPWPPTVNHYWLSGKGTHKYVSDAGNAFREDVIAIANKHEEIEMIHGEVVVALIAYPPDRRKRDIDNIKKAIYDGLTHAGVYKDDCKISVCFDVMDRVRVPDGEGWVHVDVYAKGTEPKEFRDLHRKLYGKT